jgi:hypothetical protein
VGNTLLGIAAPQVHRTILVVDVEGFGDRRRTNQHQVMVRKGLYESLERAFHSAGLPWPDCHHEDRGDGVLVLIPPEIPKGPLVESLPQALAEALATHNRKHPAEQRIRLRMALHAGEISYDDHGVTAGAINLTFRILDAPPTKAALADSPGVLALVVSSWFYEEVVRNSSRSNQATYRPVRIVLKETDTVGWICLPDHPYPHTNRALPPSITELGRKVRTIQTTAAFVAVLFLGWTSLVSGDDHDSDQQSSLPAGDLTVRPLNGGECYLRAGADQYWDIDLWFSIGWTEPAGFPVPANKIRLATDIGRSRDWSFSPVPTPPGHIVLHQPGNWIDTFVDPDERYLKRLLRISVTVDPDNTVTETVEDNNEITLVVDLRVDLPAPNNNKRVHCYQE